MKPTRTPNLLAAALAGVMAFISTATRAADVFPGVLYLRPHQRPCAKAPGVEAKEPFASVLRGDVKTALAGGEHALLEMAMATHAGMTAGEFEKIVSDWLASAKHPTTKRPYTEMVYAKPGTGGKSILSIDGKKVAEGQIPKTQPFAFSGDEGADVRVNGETNVSTDYKQGDNAFTGKTVKVTVEQK